MTRKGYAVVVLALALAALSVGFAVDARTVDLHPERHLTARDEVALVFADTLVRAQMPVPLSQLMDASYIYADEFLGAKDRYQAKLRDALITTPPVSYTPASIDQWGAHFVGNPHVYIDKASGKAVASSLVAPTPTPTPVPSGQ